MDGVILDIIFRGNFEVILVERLDAELGQGLVDNTISCSGSD